MTATDLSARGTCDPSERRFLIEAGGLSTKPTQSAEAHSCLNGRDGGRASGAGVRSTDSARMRVARVVGKPRLVGRPQDAALKVEGIRGAFQG